MFIRNLKEDKDYILPLTETQQEILFSIDSGIYRYEESICIDFKEKINMSRLSNALEVLVKTQPMLRGVFRWKGLHEPVMIVLKSVYLPVYKEEEKPIINIENEPWFIKVLNNGTRLNLTYSHLLMDGWSLGQFFTQLFTYYHKENIEDIPVNYSMKRYASSMKKLDNTKCYQFWNNYLKNYTPHLLSDSLVKKAVTTKDVFSGYLNSEELAKLMSYAKNNNLTMASICYAAWAVLVSAFTRNDDVCIGIISSGRNNDWVNYSSIGMHIKNLPLRVSVSGKFNTFCKSVAHNVINVMQNENYSNQVIYKSTGISQRQKIYDSMVVIENYPLDIKAISEKSGLDVEKFDFQEGPSFPYVVKIQIKEQLELELTGSDEIPYEHLLLLGECYLSILQQILNNDFVEIEDAKICGNYEDEIIMNEKSQWQDKSYLNGSLAQVIVESCKKYENKLAIKDNNVSLTYKGLLENITKGFNMLRNHGVQEGNPVGIFMGRSISMLTAVYSVILAGGVYMPISLSTPEDRLRYMVENAGTKLIICDTEDTKITLCNMKLDVSIITYEELSEGDCKLPVINYSCEQTAYILFTSGTTGKPKGVEISHKAILNRLIWNAMELSINQNDIQLFKTPISFDVSIIEIFQIFFNGHTLVVLPENYEKMSDKIVEYISKYEVSYIHFVPSMFTQFIHYISAMEQEKCLSILQKIVCSGEVLHADTVNLFYTLPYSKGILVINLYGPTEAAVDVSSFICNGIQPYGLVPIGKPIYNTELRILDHKERICPPYVIGELYIFGTNLGKGYINDTKRTEEFFRVAKDGNQYYYTGDLAYWDNNGNITVVGRKDSQVKFNGVRIECDEIRYHLIQSKLVDDAIVILKKGIPDHLILFYTGKKLDIAVIKEILSSKMPIYMQPSDFCYIEEMPKSINGKLDSKKLIHYFELLQEKEIDKTIIVKNLSDTENRLANIWANILEKTMMFDSTTNFFYCGGTSLMIISMITAIKKEFNVKISTQEVYNRPILGSLASYIDKLLNNANISVEDDMVEIDTNYVQRGMASMQLINKESTAYNIPIMLRISDKIESRIIFEALEQLVKEEEYLRSTFDIKDSKLIRRILNYQPLIYSEVKVKAAELSEYTKKFVRPFVLNQQLVRFEFVCTEQENRYLLFDIHHILCDQNTLKHIMETLVGILDGKKVKIVPQLISKEVKAIDRELHKEYWTQLFENYHDGFKLPTDIQEPNKEKKLRHYTFEIGSNKKDALIKYAKSKETTLFNVLFTAYFILSGKLCNKKDVIIGTNYINSIEQNCIGMYLEILPMKMILDESYTIDAILKQFMTRFKEAITNNTYSYGELLQDLNLNTVLDENPIFSMMFIREEDYFQEIGLGKYFDEIININQSTKFDISLFYHENKEKLYFSFDYNANVYLDTTISFYAKAYNKIIDLILEDDSLLIKNVELVTEQERKKYVDFCFGPIKKLNDITVQEMLVNQCVENPDGVAIICGKRQITYNEFSVMTNKIGNALEKYNVEDKFVILSMENSEFLLAAMFGVLKAGGIYLPIDVKFAENRRDYIIKDSQSVLMITDHEESNDAIPIVSIQTLLDNGSSKVICKRNNTNYAYCIYTSGSTGTPKGCVILNKGLLNYIDWANNYYCHNFRKTFAFYTSPAVDMSITSTILPLAYGHTIVIYPNQPDSIIKVMQDERINIVKATPSHLSLMTRGLEVSNNIESIIVGGEKLTINIAREIYLKFNRNVHIYNEYGPTETVVGCMIYEYNENDPYHNVPIGKPIQNTFTVVLNQKGEICPPYVKGELYIGGYGVAAGYWNKNDEINIKFVDNTIDTKYSEKMYASGDIVRVISGEAIDYIGRSDNQVKINGHRIELGEIETAASKLPNIVQTIAIIEKGKKDSNNIILYYVDNGKKPWKEIDIRNELSKVLPYYMMPVKIIRLSKMPLSSSGKINIELLPNMKMEFNDKRLENNETEQFIIECVSIIVGNSEFNINDGFFEIGLNSLSIVELHKIINERYELEIMDLFRYPSVKSLYTFLTESSEKEVKEITIKEEEFAIIGMGFQIPCAETLEEFRDILLSAKSMISYPTGQRYEDEVNKLYIEGYKNGDFKMGMTASLEHIDLFPPEFFNIGKDEADVMDPIQRLFMINITKAMYDAGYEKGSLNGAKVAIIGAKPTETDYTQFVEKYYPDRGRIAKINYVQSIMLTRIQHYYNLTGPSYLVDSACSSGLVAVNNACTHLQNRDCDIAIVGGVNLIQLADIQNNNRSDVLSDSFHANTFSDNATGTARGEGCICFVIKRLSEASEAGDKIYAIIKGSSLNNDGFASSLTAPNGLAQTNVILDALSKADVNPDDVGMVEAHGTATPLGDPIEIQALTEAFRKSTNKLQYCALSASKAIYGHMDSVAGLLGILKCIVSLQYKELYPNFQVTAPNRRINFMDSPFFIPVNLWKWSANSQNTRICSINSFGISGTNVHMILQQWPVESDEISPCTQITDCDMELKRCWIEGKPTCTYITDKFSVEKEEITSIDISRAGIVDTLCDKVQYLFPNAFMDTKESLFVLGFDSITIIQLQQFVSNYYAVNIDIEYFFEELNSLELISNYLSDKLAKKKTNNGDVNDKIKRKDDFISTPKCATKQVDLTPEMATYKLRAFIDSFAPKYIKKTNNSYDFMHKDKIHWANGRFILGNTKEMECMSYPIIVNKADGTSLWDVDGNVYLDFAMGFGANFFAYNNKEIMNSVHKALENNIILGAIRPEAFKVAEEISEMTGVERVSFCNSGSEAVMNILRIARAATGKDKVVAFKNSFHGTFDPIYTQADELGGMQALPKSIGTPMNFVSNTMLFPYGEDDVFEYLENADDVAAVLIEPVQSRHPNLRPMEFILELRKVTEEKGILMIFDEVITGFRSGLGGAQKYYGIQADLVAYGKVIGGGFPIGIFGGKSIYMDLIDHKGWSPISKNSKSAYLVNTGGTFNAHPASIAAASAVCRILKRDSEFLYARMNDLTVYMANELNRWFKEQKFDILVEHFCSQFIFTSNNLQLLRLLQYMLIYNNIYVWEGGTCFISTEHTKADIDRLINTVKQCCDEIKDVFYGNYQEIKVSAYTKLSDNKRIMKLLEKTDSVEKVYPMTNQQIGIMTENLNNRAKHQDVSYMRFILHSKIDKKKIEDSFNKTINTYETLRSQWCWRGVSAPIVLVLKKVECQVGFHEAGDNHEKIVKDILQQHIEKGFKLDKPPYITMDIIEFEDDDKRSEAEILLTYYTSIIDGWSLDLFLNYFMNNYFEEAKEKQEFNYEEYLKYLNSKEIIDNAKSFWNEYLKNIEIKSSFIQRVQLNDLKTETWNLSKDLNEKMQMVIKSISCSKASILAYCFGKVIGGPNKDSLIASTLTGRNMNIKGMSEAVGMFSYVVPIKVQGSLNIVEGLRNLNSALKHMNNLIPLIADEIADTSDLSKDYLRHVMYNSTIVFLNQMKFDTWKDIKIIEDHGFLAVPLRLYVNLDDNASILFTYDSEIYNEEDIQKLICNMDEVLNNLYADIIN